MEREEFVAKVRHVKNAGILMSEEDVRARIRRHADLEKDLPVCVGELSELILELTRYQRGKMNLDDFLQDLQELSHVQWTVWKFFHFFENRKRAAPACSLFCVSFVSLLHLKFNFFILL